MCFWKISCCRDFCRFSADVQTGENSVNAATATNVGAVTSTGQVAIEVGAGVLSTQAERSLRVGDISAGREGASSIGKSGYNTEYTKTVQFNDQEVSFGEKLGLCTDEGCCSYSISICGEGCSFNSSECVGHVKEVAKGCFGAIWEMASAATGLALSLFRDEE